MGEVEREKIEGAIFFGRHKKKKRKKKNLGWNKLTQVETNWPRLKQIDLV